MKTWLSLALLLGLAACAVPQPTAPVALAAHAVAAPIGCLTVVDVAAVEHATWCFCPRVCAPQAWTQGRVWRRAATECACG